MKRSLFVACILMMGLAGCDDVTYDAGTGKCIENEQRCNNNTVQQCKDGSWEDINTCNKKETCVITDSTAQCQKQDSGKETGEDTDSGKDTEKEETLKKIEENESCDIDPQTEICKIKKIFHCINSKWTVKQTCDDNQFCHSKYSAGSSNMTAECLNFSDVCDNEAAKCKDENTLLRCVDNKWKETECDTGRICSTNSKKIANCYTPCQPTDYPKCKIDSGNLHKLLTCESGIEVETLCSGKCGADASGQNACECVNETRQCVQTPNGNRLEICINNHWEFLSDCDECNLQDKTSCNCTNNTSATPSCTQMTIGETSYTVLKYCSNNTLMVSLHGEGKSSYSPDTNKCYESCNNNGSTRCKNETLEKCEPLKEGSSDYEWKQIEKGDDETSFVCGINKGDNFGYVELSKDTLTCEDDKIKVYDGNTWIDGFDCIGCDLNACLSSEENLKCFESDNKLLICKDKEFNYSDKSEIENYTSYDDNKAHLIHNCGYDPLIDSLKNNDKDNNYNEIYNHLFKCDNDIFNFQYLKTIADNASIYRNNYNNDIGYKFTYCNNNKKAIKLENKFSTKKNILSFILNAIIIIINSVGSIPIP